MVKVSMAERWENEKKRTLSVLIGCLLGILLSLLFSTKVSSEVFVTVNMLIYGLCIGCVYGALTAKIFRDDRKREIVFGGLIGLFCGLHYLSFSVFVFGYGFILFYLLIAAFVDERYWPLKGKRMGKYKAWAIYLFACVFFSAIFGVISGGMRGLLISMIFGAIPGVNIAFGFILGSYIGINFIQVVLNEMFKPFFLIPLCGIIGYFTGRIEEISKYDVVKEKEAIVKWIYYTILCVFIAVITIQILMEYFSVIVSFIYHNFTHMVVIAVISYILINCIRILIK